MKWIVNPVGNGDATPEGCWLICFDFCGPKFNLCLTKFCYENECPNLWCVLNVHEVPPSDG